ncbi:hypothetical protein E2C01_059014 [Portunus trituberculatus]|uniref:Uncharacterized protein n=1 Tax=Portunus trituberculatus TaxID=210409 RepID=A0A5B7H1D9_PORTR|nr:hypothetical protein [Portunus trituberculatus]
MNAQTRIDTSETENGAIAQHSEKAPGLPRQSDCHNRSCSIVRVTLQPFFFFTTTPPTIVQATFLREFQCKKDT